MGMIRKTMGAVLATGLLVVPLTATSAPAAPSEDEVKCVIRAIKESTGIYWCFATVPPDR